MRKVTEFKIKAPEIWIKDANTITVVNEYTVRNLQVQTARGVLHPGDVLIQNVEGNFIPIREDGMLNDEIPGMNTSTRLTLDLLQVGNRSTANVSKKDLEKHTIKTPLIGIKTVDGVVEVNSETLQNLRLQVVLGKFPAFFYETESGEFAQIEEDGSFPDELPKRMHKKNALVFDVTRAAAKLRKGK